MPHTAPRRHPTRAFTLVELLVVVGVIAVLVAILMPVLRRARETALLVRCTSNLRQIGSALQAYTADNGGALPWAAHDWPAASFSDPWTLLQPTVGNPAFYICPADLDPPWNQWWTSPAGWGGKNGYGGLSVPWPSSYYYLFSCYHKFDNGGGTNLPGPARQMYLRDVKYPSRKAIASCNAGHDGNPPAHPASPLLFADGHAAPVRTGELNPGNYYGSPIIHLDYTTWGLAGFDVK